VFARQLRAALRAHAPLVRSLLAVLADAGVPPTLVHGDPHPGNVAIRDGQPTVFDWTDAGVAHPFLDLATLFDDEEPTPRMADAYLESFRAVAPPARLRAPLRLGRALGALLQAVSYHQIARSSEPSFRTDWSGAIDDWLLTLCRRCRAHAAE
jgi:aminoglycoside phosphotransferase (APT) family kinase protein